MIAAATGNKGHVGGTLGGADAEGCGHSNRSAEIAEQFCCYSGHWRQSARGPYSRRLGTAVAYSPVHQMWFAVILVGR